MDQQTGVTPFYLDKGLWVTLLTPLLLLVGQKLGVKLDPADIAGIVLPLITYVVMHKWKTTQVVTANIAAAGAVEAAQLQAKDGATVDAAAKALGAVK